MKEGFHKGRLEMARQLLNAGVPIDVITQSSGLTEEEITKLGEEEQPEE